MVYMIIDCTALKVAYHFTIKKLDIKNFNFHVFVRLQHTIKYKSSLILTMMSFTVPEFCPIKHLKY